jgi:hypothetical protein
MTPRSTVPYDQEDWYFRRPDYFKLRLFKKLEVLVVTERSLFLRTFTLLLPTGRDYEQKLKAVESKYPDFKRPMIKFKDLVR